MVVVPHSKTCWRDSNDAGKEAGKTRARHPRGKSRQVDGGDGTTMAGNRPNPTGVRSPNRNVGTQNAAVAGEKIF